MDPVVELDTGFIRGRIENHEDGFDYYAFKGIPYAEPPIGELRFAAVLQTRRSRKRLAFHASRPTEAVRSPFVYLLKFQAFSKTPGYFTQAADKLARVVLLCYSPEAPGVFKNAGNIEQLDPIPKKKWTGILDCKDFGPRSCQYDFFIDNESYNEDCLNLNVYSWSINRPNENRPVLVWIHGGEFTFCAADDFYCGPDYLMRKNIVLVTIHFRLGALGFLDLEDEVAPGNQGLKDQVMALQWVQNNIRIFGGNPDNVTVGGVSAGAVSAHYLALSPLAKNLLHKIICHGGTMYSSFAKAISPKSNALKLCSFLGKTLTDSKEIVKFLKTVDTKALLTAQQRVREHVYGVIFGPGSDSKASISFMPIPENTATDQGVHLPTLVGYTSREGIITLYDPIFFRNTPKKEYFAACDLDFGTMFHYNTKEISERYNLSAKQVRRLYYKNEAISEKNLDNYVDIRGDMMFVEGVHRFARVQADMSSAATYLFRFDYESEDSISKALIKDKPTGVCHYDDIPHLFKMGLVKAAGGTYFKKGTQSYKIMEQMTEMWTNFATYGRPTVETSELTPVQWQPIADGTNLRYMNISEDSTMQTVINIDQKFLSASQIQA